VSRPVGRPVSQPCGTVAAYKRHLRHDEDPCDPCKSVWAAWQRDYYARTKAKRKVPKQ
jgi:hypothetical protein